MASTMFTDDTNRPDFQILFYPVITCETPNVHMDSRTSLIGASPSPETIAQYSLEQHVTSRTPKAFITHSADDRMVPAANSILYFNELVRNGVPASLHIYPRGGHGWCMDASFAYTEAWTHELDHWLKQLLKEQNRR